MTLIQIKELFKTYVTSQQIQTEALKDVNLTIAAGEFTAIAGPSGSGKSSLLNLIGALDKPTSGTIHYEDRDITPISLADLSEFRLKKIGFIFQAYNLIRTLTAVENVEYIMLLQNISPAARRERAHRMLEQVGLKDYGGRYPHAMSGGQQQRVAIARAMAAEPKVILADEPTANLDSTTSAALLDLMLKLNEEKGMTFIFSTHDPMIMEKAKRLIHIKDGVIQI